jgi:tyrosyl-tRNA synthetase
VKFGKSEGNAIWLSSDMTSPYAFYQYFLNIEDASVIRLLKVFTDRTAAEIAGPRAAGSRGALPARRPARPSG